LLNTKFFRAADVAETSEQEILFVAWKGLNVLANLWQTVHWNLMLVIFLKT
jgi:hypothetical protein